MFLQAGVAVFLVDALVVVTFALLGDQDMRGILELTAAAGSVTIAMKNVTWMKQFYSPMITTKEKEQRQQQEVLSTN